MRQPGRHASARISSSWPSWACCCVGSGLVTETWPLDAPIPAEQLDGWQVALAVAGDLLFALAAPGYFRLYRRRSATFVFAVTFALALLAEAMVVIAWARNWQRLVVGVARPHALAFVVIALAARRSGTRSGTARSTSIRRWPARGT